MRRWPRPRPLPRLRATSLARRLARGRAFTALCLEGEHGRAGEAAARRGDVPAAEAALRAMAAYQAIGRRWMRVAGEPEAGGDA